MLSAGSKPQKSTSDLCSPPRAGNGDEMKQKIITMVAFQGGVNESKVTPDSSLVADVGLDSLDILEVVMSVEEEFGIMIDDLVSERFATVQDIINAAEIEVSKKTRAHHE